MRSLFVIILFVLCLVLPTSTYSETLHPPQDNGQHVTQSSSNNSRPSTAISSNHSNDEDQNQLPSVSIPTQNNHRHPVNNARHNRHSNNNRPANYNRPPQHNRPPHTGPHVAATYSRAYYPRQRTYYTSTYYVEPAVVYTDNSYVVVDNTESVSYENSGKLGFGINAALSTNSSIDNISNDVSGGIGLYLKFRPVRYFSLELQNIYTFGSLKYDGMYELHDYTKSLISLGVRFHFFDYSSLDLYTVVAGGVSIWSYEIGYDYWYDENIYMSDYGVQYGGQIGLGISYIIGVIEFGADIRYTVESVPDFIPGYIDNKKDSDIIHGMLFTLNFGLLL